MMVDGDEMDMVCQLGPRHMVGEPPTPGWPGGMLLGLGGWGWQVACQV